MATPTTKIPTLTDENVKEAMGFRQTDCCSLCVHCTKHPDSGRGGEHGTTYQCVANAIHHFKLPYGETGQHICSHFVAKEKDAARGKLG
jgi:hypothetical protein